MANEEEREVDQDRFREMVRKGIRQHFGNVQAKMADATEVGGEASRLSRFLNGQKPVRVAVAKRWAKALRIPRTDMPVSLRWPARPEEEAREALAPYLSELSRMEQLPYYAVLRSMSGTEGRPPKLTDVYVRPEYRTESGTPEARGGTLPRLRQGLDDALRQSSHAVLQGAPGSGKSSAVAKLALDLAVALREGTADHGWVPIPIIAREFMALRKEGRKETFQGALSAHVRVRFDADLPSAMFSAPPPYRCGKWLLIVDGLDEIVEQETRDRLIADITRHADQAGSPYKFLVTSRPMKETGDLKSSAFARFVLLAFGKEQIDDFVRQWFNAVAPERADEMAAGFRAWLATGGMGDIVTSPSMLTIAAIVYQYTDGALPNNRIKLYVAYTDIMFLRNIQQPRGIGYALRNALNIGHAYGEAGQSLIGGLLVMQRSLFEEGALRLQSQTELDFVALTIEMAEQAPWFPKIPEDIQAEPRLMEPWIRELLRASGIVQENRQGFTFVHNTMREYLAAAGLERAITDEGDRWAFVRRWSEARWREVVLFFLSLSSGTSEGSARASASLRTILSSGPRGVHFAGTALAEGVRVDEATAAAIVDGLIVRANSWNLCSEFLGGEFRSPDVTEVLRMLAHHSKVREALMGYLRRGGNGCPKSLHAMFDLSEQITDSDELTYLAESGSALWVRVGAITGLLRRGERERAFPLVRAALPRLGSRYGIDVVLALYATGAQAELLWIAECRQASRIVRLTALLFLADGEMPEGERRERIEDLVQDIDDWAPMTGDVLVRLAGSGTLVAVLSSKALRRSEGIRFCGVLIDAGHGDMTIDYLEEAFLVGKRKDSAPVAKLLARLVPASDFLPRIRDLCRRARTEPGAFLELAELCGGLGDDRFLTEALEDDTRSISDRCRAAAAIARLDPTAQDAAFGVLRRLAPEIPTNGAWEDLVHAALAIDGSDRAVDEALSWIAAKEQDNPTGLRPLYQAGHSRALLRAAVDPGMSRDNRLYAILALGKLGEGQELHALASDPDLDVALRLASTVGLSELGWGKEVRRAALGLLDVADGAGKLSVLRKHDALGIGDIAPSALEGIRDDERASPDERLEAAQELARSPWHRSSPSPDFLAWLLQDGHPPAFRAGSLSWVANPSASDPEGVLPPSVRSRVREEIIGLLCDTKVEPSIRQRVLLDLVYRFPDAPPPDDVVTAAVALSDGIDENLLRYLGQHGREVDGVAPLLAQWSRLELDALQRMRLAEVALEVGYVDVASRELDGIAPDDLEPAGIIVHANHLRSCNRVTDGEARLRRLVEDAAIPQAERYAAIHRLFSWDAVSKETAYDLVAAVAKGMAPRESGIAMAHLNLSLDGALPDDPGVLLATLTTEDLAFEYRLLVCDVLLGLDKRAAVQSFLEAAIHDDRLKRSIPACAFLIRHMPHAVTLATVKRALSALGNLETAGLVDICAAAGPLADGQAIREEVVAFVSYCDMSQESIRSFAKDLSLRGMADLSCRFATWLTEVDCAELVEGWDMQPAAADAFLAASTAQ